MELQIDLLKTFLAIIDTGGFTKAPQIVHRTQSAISLQIKRLEETLGHSLFERVGRSSRLTIEGETLVPYARRMIKLHAEAMAALVNPGIDGEVRIGIIDDYAARFLPKILSKFAKSYAGVQITVRCEASAMLVPALTKGELDLALVTGSPNDDSDVIRHDPMVWVTSANHLVHEVDPLPLAVFHADSIVRKWPMQALDAINRNYRVAYQSPTDTGIHAIVSAGLAVSILLKSVVPETFKVLGPNDGFPDLPVAKIVLKRSPSAHSKAVECMAQYIREGMQ